MNCPMCKCELVKPTNLYQLIGEHDINCILKSITDIETIKRYSKKTDFNSEKELSKTNLKIEHLFVGNEFLFWDEELKQWIVCEIISIDYVKKDILCKLNSERISFNLDHEFRDYPECFTYYYT